MKKSSQSSLPSTSSILLVLVSIVLFFCVAPGPLLGTLTAESALLFAAVLGPFTFIAAACRGANRDPSGFTSDFLREGAFVALGLVFYLSAAWINSWRFESCSTDTGLLPFIVLAIPVLLLNLCLGLWLGRIIGHVKLSVFAALVVICLYIAAQFSIWWVNPTLHFFNHNWIMIAGDLLQGQSISPAIIGFRLATFLYACVVFLFGTLAFSNVQRHRMNSGTPATTLIVMGLIIAGAATVIHIQTARIISPSRSSMQAEYSVFKHRGPLVVHADPSVVTPSQMDAILAEGTLWLNRLHERSGIKSHGNIHIWLHSNADRQAFFTGAKHVHFALPSHREIHISNIAIPHPTLGHEIAHILIGQESNTIWGVPGVFNFIPNTGLTEGLAVMLTPELAIRDELTLEEQTAAIYRLGFEQDFDSLFDINPSSFWFKEAGTAYASAGAFLTNLLNEKTQNLTERYALIQTLASTGQLYPIWKNSQDEEQFTKRFVERLKSMPLPSDAMNAAALRFSSGGFATEQCSRAQDSIEHRIQNAAGSRHYERAKTLIANLDKSKQAESYVAVAQTAYKLGDLKTSVSFLELALSQSSTNPRRAQWVELQADYQFDTRPQEAQRLYRSIDLSLAPLPTQRELAVKINLMQSILFGSENAATAQAGMRLLTLQTPDATSLAARYAAIAYSTPTSPVTDYLIGRGQITGDNYKLGLKVLLPLVETSTLPSELNFETHRLISHGYAMTQELGKLVETLERMRSISTRPSYQLYISDFLERARYVQSDRVRNRWLLGLPTSS